MTAIDLAIYILFYEKVDQTIECIKSFLPSNLRIYVLNNNSSANSRNKLAEFCQDFSNVKIFDSDTNLGVGRGRNFLINSTTEEWMFFVDNDITIKTDNWLEKAEYYINTFPEIKSFIPKLYNIQKNIYETPKNLILKDKEVFFSSNYAEEYTNILFGGCSIIKREIFNEIGLYDEEMFIGFEDFELAIRALLNNIPVKAKLIDDIDLVHDHRVVKKSEDKNAVKERYNENHIEKSVKRIEDKFNIKFKASWRRWHKNQLKIILKGKDLSFIIFNFLSNTKSWFFDKVFSCR